MEKQINRSNLYSTQECADLGFNKDKLKTLVKQGKLKRVKNKADNRFTYYYRSEVQQLAAQKDEFYEV